MKLTPQQRDELEKVVRSNKNSIRQRCHARILLAADVNQTREDGICGGYRDEEICQIARTSLSTVGRIRMRFVEEGLQACLHHKEQKKRKERALNGRAEAHLIAIVCGAPPEGHKQWTLRLLSGVMIEQGYVDYVSHETIRQTLKKMNLSPG